MATVVLDNGAYTAKVGFGTDLEPKIMPNCVMKAKNVRTRIFIGDQVDDCKDLSGLYYILAFQKGYLVNWEIQRQVWDFIFGKERLKVNFSDTSLLLTEPYFNFTSIQESINEILFEDYGFKSTLRCNAGLLTQHKATKDRPAELCCLVVDSGYSFTHIVPYYKGEKIKEAICRINVGGKILSNHLKEIISYRQLMVMDETHVMNQCKEDVSYVSQNFWEDMAIAKKRGKANTVARDYVLPDYSSIKRGYVKPVEETSGKAKGSEQIIRMNNERFAVPEILFHPSDVGVQEMGIPEAIVYSISKLEEAIFTSHSEKVKKAASTQSNASLEPYSEHDVREITPAEYEVSIFMPSNPITYAWEGGSLLSQDPDYSYHVVTKQEYEECGHNICFEKFDI